MQFTVKVEWQQNDGSIASSSVATIDLESCQSAADVGLKLVEGKCILSRLEQIVVDEQLRRYCEAKQTCPACGRHRNLKDNRMRLLQNPPTSGLKWRFSPLARHCGLQSVEMSRVGGKKPDFRPRRNDALRAPGDFSRFRRRYSVYVTSLMI